MARESSFSAALKRSSSFDMPIDIKEIVRKNNNHEFVNGTGPDPGYNTWNATTQQNIQTGKEASIIKTKIQCSKTMFIRFFS